MGNSFNNNEQDRYSRQILFHDIGESGQNKLSKSKVLKINCYVNEKLGKTINFW